MRHRPGRPQRLTELAHAAVRAVVRAGDWVVDATAGNGHDTRFLAEQVGPTGRVFAFDIQPEALTRTAAAVHAYGTVELLLADHAELATRLPPEARGRLAAVMFNLGYLPGGPKHVVTRPQTTCRAIRESLRLLRPGGVVTVIVYPAHPGGAEEAAAVTALWEPNWEPKALWEPKPPGTVGAAGEDFTVTGPIGGETPTRPALFVLHKQRR